MMMSESVIYGLVNSRQARYNARRRQIILSPALIDRSLGDRLIALRCHDTDTITLFNVCTGHVYV